MVTLLSNGSMAMYPKNTGNCFTNRLGEPIDLRGAVMNEDQCWEVAMADIQYTNVFQQFITATDVRIAVMYPREADEADIMGEAAAAAVSQQQSLEINDLGDITHGGTGIDSDVDDALASLHNAGLVTSSSSAGQEPAEKAKGARDRQRQRQQVGAIDYDKQLYQAAREAWQKGCSHGLGGIMFDHYLKGQPTARQPDVIDERVQSYVDERFHYRLTAVDSEGERVLTNAETATIQVKIPRGNYVSPLAIAYIISATYNLIIDQLVKRPKINTHMHVVTEADGKIVFVSSDKVVHHMMVMDDDRLAKMLGLTTTPLFADETPVLHKASLRGSGAPWLGAYVPNMFVYCDIVTDQYVGDVMAPLLDLVPVKHAAPDERMQYSLIPPAYLEVAKKFADTIHVEIRDDKGALVPFDDTKGAVVVRLHFRRKGALPSFVM